MCFRVVRSFLVFVVAGFAFGSSAVAQSEWADHYPPPVHVASFEEEVSSGVHSQPRGPERPGVAASGSSVPTFAEPLRPIGHDSSWNEMPSRLPAPPHLVIQAPTQKRNARFPDSQMTPVRQFAAGHHETAGGSVRAHADRPLHPHPHLPEFPGVENDPSAVGPGHLGAGTHWLKTQPRPRQTIPAATVQPTWKTPYSYGYFGSEGKRHWTRQFGYRDRHLQWTLR